MKSLEKLFRYGPGPSSSHTIAPAIAARSFKHLLDPLSVDSVTVTLYGSLALTGIGHGTDHSVQSSLLPYASTVFSIPKPASIIR
jgi:L-serine dehydratase